MFNKTVLSARNPVAAMGYALMAYATAAAVYAQQGGVAQNQDGLAVVRVFLNNISGILNAASIVVVTVAIVFAFNNRRISEVAPVLIGGVLIGGAAQIANMLVASGQVGQV